MNSAHCDENGRCQGVIPGTKGIHLFLHDNVALYRAWHHSPLRTPTHTIITVLAIALASVTVFQLTQQTPAQAATGILAQLPFQGRLTNTDGTVISNGSYDAVFKLYTVSSGGAAVWTESHTGANKITTVSGVFSTMLGSLTSLTGIDFNQDTYYLGITVGADAEMTPRIRLGAAPYAFNTDKLDGVSSENFLQLPGQAGGQTAFGGTAASENLVLRSTSNATKGNIILGDDGVTPIGVGLADPFQSVLGSVSLGGGGIHVDTGSSVARVLLEGNDPSYEIINNTAAAGQKWTELFQSTSGYFGIFTRDDAGTRLQPSNANPAFAVDNSSGYAGVGTANPDAKFTVETSSTTPATNALNVHATWNSGGTYDANNTIVTDTSSGAFSTLMSALRTNGVNTLTSYAVGKNGILMAGNPTGSNDMRINLQGYTSTAANGTSISFDRHDGTFASPIAVSNGDKLGSLDFNGGYTTSSATASAAQIIAEVDGTPGGAADMPGRLLIKTTPDGSGTLVTRLTVTNAGNIVPGTGALATGATDGFIYLSSMAGVPSGTPTIYTGRVPLAYNSTSNILYAYNSGWQALGGGGGGITGSGAAGQVTVWNGASSVTGDAEYLYNSTDNRLSIGATPSFDTTAVLNIPNNKAISARSASGASNYDLIKLGTNDQLLFGPTGTPGTSVYFDLLPSAGEGNFAFNSSSGQISNVSVEGGLAVYNSNNFGGSVATTGAIRLPNNVSVSARNSGNTADINLIKAGTNGQIVIGPNDGSSNDVTFDLLPGAGVGTFAFNSSSGQVSNVSVEGALQVYNSNNFSGFVAATGAVRLPNNTSVSARNASNTADISLIKAGTNGQIIIGPNEGSSNDVTFDILAPAGVGNFSFNSSNAQISNVSVEGALLVYNANGFAGSTATTGAIRLKNNDAVVARNAADSADINLLKLGTNDQLLLGPTGTPGTSVYFDLLPSSGEGNFAFNSSNGQISNVSIEGALQVYGSNGFGSNISTTGIVRLPNNSSISARNAGNSTDISIAKLNASNNVELGADTTVIGDYYDTTIPSAVSSTTLCISGGGQIGTCTSDARLKTNIAQLGSGLDVIEHLSPKTYDFISGQTGQSGFLAQDVQQLLPGLVTKDTGDDYLSLNYNGIVAYTVKAIQELSQKVDDLPVSSGSIPKNIVVATVKTGDLTVTGTATLQSLDVATIATIRGTLNVKQTVTAESDLIVKNNLSVAGAIIGSSKTRGINVAVPATTNEYTVSGLAFDSETPYAVSITPSWITNFAVTNKTNDGFTVTFSTEAPSNATFDYFVQQ